MIREVVHARAKEWLNAPGCPVAEIVKHIRAKGELREVQIEAIETYLFLKIRGDNKPLWRLFAEGFFTPQIDLSAENINERARNKLEESAAARALWHWARNAAPPLSAKITESPDGVDYEAAAKQMFYGVEYADYLMSLPMGAGKTWLMAAFIYLDLYFASNEPDNSAFAHNFLVLAPSGLLSSIVPSLRTIEQFDPSWVLPEPAASQLKAALRFEVLDRPASGNKSNRTRNPNAHKVNQYLPAPFGCVFVVNAEKVILNRTDIGADGELLEKSGEEQDHLANELRSLLGKIPRLSILIDEVHHATSGDIKLRQVVNKWCDSGNICTVLGFTGTPFESGRQHIAGVPVTPSEITNTVYYYPLMTAIQNFLKRPQVKDANLSAQEIVGKAVADFRRKYKNTVYSVNGAIAKMAIYCTSIETLETEIYPYMTERLKIPASEILRFHKGNKEHPKPAGSERDFRELDSRFGKKRYVLLVGIGREGWDCRSLASVVLPQKSKSTSATAIVQTACRCLRQADKDKDETALIWLNQENASTLNQRLKKEQKTSTQAVNAAARGGDLPLIDRHSRIKPLRLPPIEFCQLKVTYHAQKAEKSANTRKKLEGLAGKLRNYKSSATIRTSDDLRAFCNDDRHIESVIRAGDEVARYDGWLHSIAKESLGALSVADLLAFDAQLKPVFNGVTCAQGGARVFNKLYDIDAINARVRLAFAIKRVLLDKCEAVQTSAELLLAQKLTPVPDSGKLYPGKDETAQILEFDANPKLTEEKFKKAAMARAKKLMDKGKIEDAKKELDRAEIQPATRHRDRSFHYIPHNFAQSGMERDALRDILRLGEFANLPLEIYYNGARGLTEFVIDCYAQRGGRWQSVGRYTPDFLIINRKCGKIHKALILETKGAIFGQDPNFQARREFMETAFLRKNSDKFGYRKFDFLYITDNRTKDENLERIGDRITEFFAQE